MYVDAKPASAQYGMTVDGVDRIALTFWPERAYAASMAQVQGSVPIDWTECAVVESVPGKVSGVPTLKGSRMPADAIVENYTDGLLADEIADVFELPTESVRQLLVYALARDPSLKR